MSREGLTRRCQTVIQPGFRDGFLEEGAGGQDKQGDGKLLG